MGAMTASENKSEQNVVARKCVNFRDKTRPITATLDHPLILDIKLLKKLDMTTFTKKGLIALSKFCGISLINKTDSKRKLNKCVKTIQYLKKQAGGENKGLLPKCPTVECNHGRPRRKQGKQATRGKPRIRFKATEEGNSQEEDSSEVVCKRHDRALKALHGPGAEARTTGKKALVEEILSNSTENVIPEPCKTCSRSEHPERFHSHPKMSFKSATSRSTERNLEERFKNSVTTKDSEDGGSSSERRKRQSANDSEGELTQVKEHQGSTTPEKVPPRRPVSKSPLKGSSSGGLQSPEVGNKPKARAPRKPLTPSPSETKSTEDTSYLKKTNSTRGKTDSEGPAVTPGAKGTPEDSASASELVAIGRLNIFPVEETMKFVTGCYVCGRQVSAKARIKHEESCIAEWRTRNRLLSPSERKPEPRRPDFRFTAGGDVDCEGTFESIWANHKESLVPCKKCGRTFFPDRIERHESVCNNIPITVKYKH